MAKRPQGRLKKQVAQVTCSCLVLCDDVVISHARGKHTLAGIIGGIGVAQLGAMAGPYVAYVRLSNVHTDQRVTVGLERPSGTLLWEFEAQLVNRNDPLAVHTLIAHIPGFLVDEPGRHMLIARHENVPVAQAPIEVMIPPSTPSP